MSAQILDGKALAQSLKDALKAEVSDLSRKTGATPRLVNILVGDDHGACAYARSQRMAAEHIGVRYELITLPPDTTQDDLIAQIRKLNADDDVNGIMIHKPLPGHIHYGVVANYVETNKDLEGINVANIGKMILGDTKIIPCTPAAAMEHIRATGVELRGKEAVIIGHSHIVGKPLSLLLLEEYATVTVCHIATSEAGRLREHVGRADILIVAVGKPALIPGAWIKRGAVVIDVGINRQGDTVVGDVDFEGARKRAAFLTPVPGGVGPVTVVMLMRNGIEAYKMQMTKRGI